MSARDRDVAERVHAERAFALQFPFSSSSLYARAVVEQAFRPRSPGTPRTERHLRREQLFELLQAAWLAGRSGCTTLDPLLVSHMRQFMLDEADEAERACRGTPWVTRTRS